jgi:hypothetical protein
MDQPPGAKSMSNEFTQAELEAFLDEALSAEDMAEIETRLRSDKQLAARLRAIHGRRDAGVHSLGEIWRRHRIACPDREDLGSYLLGVLDEEHADFISFHIEVTGCRYCGANVRDMQTRQHEANESSKTRRRRFFQSSAGLLGKDVDG